MSHSPQRAVDRLRLHVREHIERHMKHYNARWSPPGQPSTGNVSFDAIDDDVAKRKADKIARELGLTSTPRMIYEGARCVEILDRGCT